MKKIFMTLIASMLLLSSTTYATESVNHKTHMVQKQAMTKQDMQAVFGTQHVKASSLNNGEMVKTEGEFWNLIYLFTLATVAANAPTKAGEIFKPNRNGYLFTPVKNPVKQTIYW